MDFHVSMKNDDIYLTCKGTDKLSEKEQAINRVRTVKKHTYTDTQKQKKYAKVYVKVLSALCSSLVLNVLILLLIQETV